MEREIKNNTHKDTEIREIEVTATPSVKHPNSSDLGS
jgi:hypothetical protein